MPARRFASFRAASTSQRPLTGRFTSSSSARDSRCWPRISVAPPRNAPNVRPLRRTRRSHSGRSGGSVEAAQIDWKRPLFHRSSIAGALAPRVGSRVSARARRLPRPIVPMPRYSNAHLAQVLAAPDLVAGLEVVDVPPLLGALEQLRASLWARMLRAPAASPATAADAADQVLTVADVASELQFTRAYVYEAVRRGDLPAIRKGRYVRVRRADLRAWLDGHGPGRLDGRPASLDSARDGQSRSRRGGNSGRMARVSARAPVRLERRGKPAVDPSP